MAYTKNNWEIGTPITKDKMDVIENGIQDAHLLAQTALDNISTATSGVSQLTQTVGTHTNAIDNIQNILDQHGPRITDGENAWNQIDPLLTKNNSGSITQTLYQRIIHDEEQIDQANDSAQTAKDWINAAKAVGGLIWDTDQQKRRNAESLAERIGEINRLISDANTSINGINQTIAPTGQRSFAERLNSLDGGSTNEPTMTVPAIITEISNARGQNSQGNNNTTLAQRFLQDEARLNALDGQESPSRTLPNVITEINNAHESTTLGKTTSNNNAYSSIKARFEAIEAELIGTTNMNSRLDGIDTELSLLSNGKVNKSDIANNLTTETVGKVLDATQGKVLKDTIGSSYSSSNTVETAISGLDARLDDLDGGSAIGTTNGTLAARVTALETEVDMASADSRIDELENRMDAVDADTTGSIAVLADRVTTVEGDIDTIDGDLNNQGGIKARLTTVEGVAATALQPADITTLTSDVNNLKDKDTIVINYDGEHSNYTNNIPNIDSANIKVNADYLIADDNGKYFYWRYINNNWKLISSASNGDNGTGSSSGEFAASLTSTDIPNPDINIDYFVGDNTVGYTHYRYVIPEGETEGEFVRILPKGLIQDATITANGGLSAHTLEDPSTNIFSNFVALKNVSYDVVQKNGVDTTVITFIDTNGVSHDVDVVSGGGGGSAQTVRLNNTLSSLNLTVPDKEGVVTYLRAKAIVKDGSEIDTNFSAALNVATQYTLDPNGAWTNFTTQQVQNNVEFSVNISNILRTGVKTYVRLVLTTIIDEATVTRTVTYEVSKVEMSITAVNFNPAIVRTTDFNFAYRCMGSGLTKTIHFLIDDENAITPVVTTLHNERDQQTIPVTGLQPGMHSFKVYFTVDGVESNILNYYILYNNVSSRQEPIVAIAAANNTITYGDDLDIYYTVATVGTETTDRLVLELYALNGSTEVPYSSTTMENVTNERFETWRPTDYPESGTAYIRATATHTINGTDYTDTKTIQITINELELPEGYSLEPKGENSLIYSYTTYGRSNNDVGKETYNYTYRAITGQDVNWTGQFNNFNWSGNGYKDNTLVISGGATHTINVTPFQTSINGITLENTEGINDISRNGRTIEIEYEVQSATNLNDVIIDCMSNVTTTTTNGVTKIGGTGFRVTPQACYLLKSGSTVDTDETGFMLNESDIAAAYLTPGMRIHLAFVIEPWSDTLAYDQSYHQSVNIYVNGEFANTCPYVRGTDNFASDATLRIGSSSCIIKLYQIKVYNRGLSHSEILQNYKVAPAATRDKIIRLEDNDILDINGKVDYEKARTKYTCLLLTGPEPIVENGIVTNPTVSPYKGYPSPANRKDKKTGEVVGKTESGVTLTKPNSEVSRGYDIEFDLRDKIPTDQSIEVPTYMGNRGAYCSSNNVQGTSSQKYPVHNLKVYLAKWSAAKAAVYEEDPNTHEQVLVSEATPAEIKKVKYSLKGKDEHGDDIGYAESTLCWKADYMSTDHANTFNANIADGLFTDTLPGASWGAKHQNTVYGIRCLLFQQQGNNAPEFLGDGCLNNDKGNNKTYDLERVGDEDADTASQKWEFTNNSDDLGYFKTDTIFKTVGEGVNAHIQALDAFESTYPDQGDLEDADLTPNYNHLQVLLTWLSKRANYWDENDPTARATKKQIFIDEFEDHINMNHALTYYIFSEYIALCDNRVKNMFLRSDNIRSEVIRNTSGTVILNGNNEPDALWSNYVNTSTGVTDPTYIDWQTGEGHSNFAIWAPVLYDLDSCFGVENVGYLRVRYDADWDYTWNNAPQFNGYESRLWLQFADCFDNEIKAAALTLYNRQDGLNYTNFYRQQITGNLNCISPALSNQDMLIKFDKPWSEGFMNYSLAEPAMETPYYKYLQRGSRTAQKTQFMNMRSKLLSSKYGANEFTNDAIKFRTGVPVGASGNIIGYENQAHEIVSVMDDQHTIPIYGNGDLTETKITVTANQVMYPGVAYGDNKAPTRALSNNGKIIANQSCDIYATSAVQGNDGIFICGASMLTDIGDLSTFRPYQIDVGAGINLKKLIVGSNAAGYTNGNTDGFMNLNKCVLLEEVNVRNCTNVSTLDLSNNALIKNVYAAGSGTTTIIFPNGGVLDTVEYSASTGNITILNQKNLNSFTYENANTNHYSSLTKLWIENTPNVPIVDIINTRLTGLTAGIRLVGIDIDLYNGASTQEEIDAALETTTLFLNTLVSDVALGKYIDSEGAFIPGNTQPPYITGKVHVTSIRNSLLAKLHTMYPNLIVYNTIDGNGTVNNNVITEYEIKYYNYDGETLLYTDYRTGREHFIDPASLDPLDVDPITNDRRIPIPTKPEDPQYKYTFGTYDNDTYVRFSGWVKQYTTTNPTADDYPQGNTVFIAVYPTTQTQRYTVNWYEEPTGAAILSYERNYGTDMSELTQPEERGAVTRIKVVDNIVKVFKGWDRPVGKLTGNTNVYAIWETSTIDNGTWGSAVNSNNQVTGAFTTEEMAALNAADLAAIARLGPEAKQRLLDSNLGNNPIMIQMGHDFDYTAGVNTTNLLGNANKFTFSGQTTDVKIYDGAHGLDEIRPLSVNSDWTLAIDYKFLFTSAMYNGGNEYVLASCYSNIDSTVQGFKLSLVKNTNENQYIRLSWGTNNITLDYLTIDSNVDNAKQYSRSYRNVIVLRHKSSEANNLYVYYTAPNLIRTDIPYGSNINSTTTNSILTWNNSNILDAPLILGGNYVDPSAANLEIENERITRKPAKGIIYWAKFWDKDLGGKNCNLLAAWPHETIPFYLSGYDNETLHRQIIENTNLTFVAAQAISDRYAYPALIQPETTNGWYGWRESMARTICNNRIYTGMPIAYQSIILTSGINSVTVNVQDSSDAGIGSVKTADYFYLPAEGEVSNNTLTSKKVDEILDTWARPWPWMQANNIKNLYGFKTNSNSLELKSASTINPFLYRFIGNYIKPTNHIFDINTNPDTGEAWNFIDEHLENHDITVQSGDVWINNDVAYIYYTNAEINEGIYVDEITTNGGWKKADIWGLRTYDINQHSPNETRFEVIRDNGQLLTAPANNPYRSIGRILCPEFSI